MVASAVAEELLHAALITGLVFVMMALVELATVATHGHMTQRLTTGRLRQYLVAAVLGLLPGCAGTYLAVSMYSHGSLSLGAVTAALIATAGDESFVMLAMIPEKVPLLAAILFATALVGGAATDTVLTRLGLVRRDPCALSGLHEEDLVRPAAVDRWIPLRLRLEPALPRLVLIVAFALLLVGLFAGGFEHHEFAVTAGEASPHGHDAEAWIFGVVLALGIGIVAVAPRHYVEEHLWEHVGKHHAPRIFLWTAGTLLLVRLAGSWLNLGAFAVGHSGWVLVGACLLGIIPQSGPHLIVLALFATGQVPFSVLVGNSIVQDGHGLLPLLGIAPRDAVLAKAANLVLGLAVGGAMLAAGW
jgi:hypothetical protein